MLECSYFKIPTLINCNGRWNIMSARILGKSATCLLSCNFVSKCNFLIRTDQNFLFYSCLGCLPTKFIVVTIQCWNHWHCHCLDILLIRVSSSISFLIFFECHSLLTIEDLLVPTLFPLFMGVQLASNILFYENKIKWVSYVYICLLPSMFLDTDPCPLSKDSMTVFWKSYLSFDLIW